MSARRRTRPTRPGERVTRPHGDRGWATLTLEPDVMSPRLARQFVASILRDWELDHLLDQAQLLTSELATNAVLHARTPMVLTVTRDDERAMLRVTVLDNS